MFKFLDGKKTYIVAFASAAVVALFNLGYLEAQTANSILALLGATGYATLRSSQAKIEDKIGRV